MNAVRRTSQVVHGIHDAHTRACMGGHMAGTLLACLVVVAVVVAVSRQCRAVREISPILI